MPPRTRAAAPGSFPPVPAKCVVTGGSGFVGQRLVEMLIERGAERVVSFDVAPKPRGALEDARIVYQQGDLTKLDDVLTACEARGWRAFLRAPPPPVCGFAATRRTLTLLTLRRARTACGTSPRWWGRTMSIRRTTTSTTRAHTRRGGSAAGACVRCGRVRACAELRGVLHARLRVAAP